MSRIKTNEGESASRHSVCIRFRSTDLSLYFRSSLVVTFSDHSWPRNAQTHTHDRASALGKLGVSQLMHSFDCLVCDFEIITWTSSNLVHIHGVPHTVPLTWDTAASLHTERIVVSSWLLCSDVMCREPFQTKLPPQFGKDGSVKSPNNRFFAWFLSFFFS